MPVAGAFKAVSCACQFDNSCMFSKLFRRKAPPEASSAQPPVRVVRSDPGAIVYPPHDPGLPLVTSEDLVEAQAALLRRLKVHAAQSPALFEQRFLGPVRRTASYIGNLPATSDGIYSGPGGAFRASVDLAFATFQASDGRIFTGGLGVEQRHLLEARWRYVCFLAGLLWPVGVTLETLSVTSADGKNWSPRVGGLEQWALSSNVARVYCSWPMTPFEPGPSPTAGAVLLSIIGEEPIKWLETGSPGLLTALIAICSGMRTENNGTAFDLVQRMWERVSEVELARRPQSYGRLRYGAHAGPHLVDAMRALLDSGTWAINQPPLFADAKGVYLVWPDAAQPIQEQMRANSLHGVPSTAAGLLAQLEGAGLIQTSLEAGPFVEVASNDGEILSAVKLAKPNSLIENYNPQDFKKSRPVAMEDVVKEDKLALVATASQKTKSEPPIPTPAPEPASAPDKVAQLQPPKAGEDVLQQTLVIAESETPAVVPPVVTQPARSSDVSRAASAPKDAPEVKNAAAKTPAPTGPVNGVKAAEGEEIRYAENLPIDVRRTLKPLVAEQLGKLVVQSKKSDAHTRRLNTGLAVQMDALKEVAANPFDFLRDLSLVGYLHVDPSKPGKLVHDVLIPEGSSNKCTCFILSTVLTDKVGL